LNIAAGMSEASFAPKFTLVNSHTFDKKKFAMPKSCTISQTFVPLQLKIVVLVWQCDAVKMYQEPLMRIVDLIEKKTHISPKLLHIYCFVTVNIVQI
jgi:hypothetical protein